MRIESANLVLSTTSEKQTRQRTAMMQQTQTQPALSQRSGGVAAAPSQAASDLLYRFDGKEQMQTQSQSSLADGVRLASREVLASQLASTLLTGQEALQVAQLQPLPNPGTPFSVQGSAQVSAARFLVMESNQSLTLAAGGQISTQDGRHIDFTLYLQRDQSSRHQASESLVMRLPPRTDPLIINFGAESVTLENTFFKFDLNGDGVTEELARLGEGSGFLVFDQNGNGRIDDGKELFGPATGSGFGELARYDADANGWIDENDPVFDRLQVWTQGKSGDRLVGLRELGIGALYLGAQSASYELLGKQGTPLGSIKAQSLMVMENGQIRTLEEIDLVDQRRAPVASTGAVSASPASAVVGSSPSALRVYAASLVTASGRFNQESDTPEVKTRLEMLIEKWVCELARQRQIRQAQSKKYSEA